MIRLLFLLSSITLIIVLTAFSLRNNESISVSFINASGIDSLTLDYKEITLLDNEEFLINHDWPSQRGLYGNSSKIGFEMDELAPKPFIIRSYETHASDFELLTNYGTDMIIENMFEPESAHLWPVIGGPYHYIHDNYNSIHSNFKDSPFLDTDVQEYNVWRNKLGDDPNSFMQINLDRRGLKEEEICLFVKTFGKENRLWTISFFHVLMREKIAREAIADYIAFSFKKVENKIPKTIKQRLVETLSDLIVFVENDIQDIIVKDVDTDWPSIVETGSNRLNYLESFLVRRLHIDKVPVNELKSYLVRFKNLINQGINDSKVSNMFTTKINNELLLNEHNIHDLKIISQNSSNEIIMKKSEGISVKCLKNNSENFYQFERKSYGKYEFLGLYNSKLELIRPASSK